jgi:hypothetical protein
MGGRAGLSTVEFTPKMEKFAAGSRKLHQQKLYKILLAWRNHGDEMREMRNSNKILTRKPKGKTPSARLRGRWERWLEECGLHSSGSG